MPISIINGSYEQDPTVDSPQLVPQLQFLFL